MDRIQFRVLYRQFLLRIVDLELVAPQGDIGKLLGQFVALLLLLGLWILLPSVGVAALAPSQAEMGLLIAWMEAHFLISTTMLVVGLFAVLSWDSMFPDRRDVLVLSPLPLRARTLFLAKLAAVASALSLTVLALNVFPGVAAPFLFASTPTPPPPPYDPAMVPVSATDLKAVLDRDLTSAKSDGGALAPGTYAGVAVGVLDRGGRRVFVYGTAEKDSIFEIGSITKTFTALVLARMVEQGRVKLDEPVRELLPPGTVAKPQGGEITLLDLATHHSGLPRIPDNFRPAFNDDPYADYHAAQLDAYLGKHGVAKPPAADYVYSNLGYGLLGHALALGSQMPYPFLVQEEVTGPLGMLDTVVVLSEEKQKRAIHGHEGGSSHRGAHEWHWDALAGSGALHSTAGDMLTYLDAELHPEKSGELEAALAKTHELRADANQGLRIGLGWFYDARTGEFSNDGVTGGYSSDVFFSPARDYAVVVLCNIGDGPVDFATQLGEHIRQRLLGQPAISLRNPESAANRSLPLLRSFAAYWLTMLASGAFIFCCTLSVQGLAQLLPRQWFLRLSAVLQMSFFGLLLTVYFLQPGFSSLESLLVNQKLVFWLPSYWFFGLFQELNGTMPPVLELLARRAWIGLGLSGCGAALAYLICYFRTLRKIAEQPDILPGRAGLRWLPRFGDAFATAIVQFGIRTLLRSRQHRVVLSFYLGLAFGLAIFFSNAPVLRQRLSASNPWGQVNAPMLVASAVLMGAAVLGARVVFSLPLDLRANWIFRVTPMGEGSICMSASRRTLYVLAIIPVWTATAALFLWMWPWRPAAGHLVVLGLFAAILAELCLYNFHKIPFTCSYLPGKSYAHMALFSFLGAMFLIEKGADAELRALQTPAGFVEVVGFLGILVVCARWRTMRKAKSPQGRLQFEEAPVPTILLLGLNRDGSSILYRDNHGA